MTIYTFLASYLGVQLKGMAKYVLAIESSKSAVATWRVLPMKKSFHGSVYQIDSFDWFWNVNRLLHPFPYWTHLRTWLTVLHILDHIEGLHLVLSVHFTAHLKRRQRLLNRPNLRQELLMVTVLHKPRMDTLSGLFSSALLSSFASFYPLQVLASHWNRSCPHPRLALAFLRKV